jgi:hypothetical protein
LVSSPQSAELVGGLSLAQTTALFRSWVHEQTRMPRERQAWSRNNFYAALVPPAPQVNLDIFGSEFFQQTVDLLAPFYMDVAYQVGKAFKIIRDQCVHSCVCVLRFAVVSLIRLKF